MKENSGSKEKAYYVDGLHCTACEILIEKKLLNLDNVHSVEASLSRSRVLVEYTGEAPTTGQLNKLFKEDGYRFSLQASKRRPDSARSAISLASLLKIVLALVVSIGLIVLLQKAGLTRLVTVDSKSSLPAFLLLGLVAGFSSCAALVGGLVLSMSKQWGELYAAEDPLKKRLEPHLLFNVGRLVSYAGLGALLALIGGTLRLTPSLSAVLVIAVSLIMVVLGLQMLGIRFLQRFQFTMPRSITRYVADENNFKGRYMPLTLGALTFFLPCGFTITAQSFALISGNPLQGSLIMLAFALGTLPMLLMIGFSSVKFLEKPHLATTFLKVAGILVIFFAFFNINSQLVVLDAPNLGDIFSPSSPQAGAEYATAQLPPIVNGKQLLKMEASAEGYSPNSLAVRSGMPVIWEIRDVGTSGCTNAIISKDLFPGEIKLTPGETSTKEFTPPQPGRYRFSCWMGMVSGTIDVMEEPPVETEPEVVEPTAEPLPERNKDAAAGDTAAASGLPPIVDGKQILTMRASAEGYSPDYLKVRVSVPVRWEIEDVGTSGCTNAVIALGLFDGEIPLTPGETSVKEFTPDQIGRFRFSCWMGMVQGVIDVVDETDPNRTVFEYDETTFPDSGGCCGS